MNILFISSGNTKNGISPIIKNQGESLVSLGHRVSYFTIQGKGFKGYFKNIFMLRNYLKLNKHDVIHAHYGLCGITSLLAKKKECLVVSFMGDDLLGSNNFDGSRSLKSRMMVIINKTISKYFYDATIVKSQEMISSHGQKNNLFLIANGIDLNRFQPLSKEDCRKEISWLDGHYHMLFAANPDRIEKNYELVYQSLKLVSDKLKIKLHFLKDIPNDTIPIYMNAADVIILSSLHEGSPNVVKEAMACNCPIISTNVGDVKWVFGNTNGCYITKFDPQDCSDKIIEGLKFGGKTKGREQIIALGLDSETVAKKIIGIYNKILKD